jgi:hypothetical protein
LANGSRVLVNRAPFSVMSAPEASIGSSDNNTMDALQAASELWVRSAGEGWFFAVWPQPMSSVVNSCADVSDKKVSGLQQPRRLP